MNEYYKFILDKNNADKADESMYVRNSITNPVLERPTLRSGDQGDYVRQLQTELKQLMFYNGEIDGIFGGSTASSVRAFQTNNKLSADGIVGKDTWSALIYLYSPLAICEETQDVHIVQPGDTLWSISRTYNTTVDDLIRLNNLNTTLLTIGQRLTITTKSDQTPPPDIATHTVKSGDTLWNIAKRYNITVDELKNYNNLTTNTMSIGQQLKIPLSEDIDTYTVQKGDTLWSIANRFGTTVDNIKRLNGLSNNLLSIGQQLKIQ